MTPFDKAGGTTSGGCVIHLSWCSCLVIIFMAGVTPTIPQVYIFFNIFLKFIPQVYIWFTANVFSRWFNLLCAQRTAQLICTSFEVFIFGNICFIGSEFHTFWQVFQMGWMFFTQTRQDDTAEGLDMCSFQSEFSIVVMSVTVCSCSLGLKKIYVCFLSPDRP